MQASIEWLPVLIGFIVSAITGLFAIKMVNWLIKSEKFRIFAYYTMILGVVVIGLGIYTLITG